MDAVERSESGRRYWKLQTKEWQSAEELWIRKVLPEQLLVQGDVAEKTNFRAWFLLLEMHPKIVSMVPWKQGKLLRCMRSTTERSLKRKEEGNGYTKKSNIPHILATGISIQKISLWLRMILNSEVIALICKYEHIQYSANSWSKDTKEKEDEQSSEWELFFHNHNKSET